MIRLVDWPNTTTPDGRTPMNREPVRIFGYPVTALLVATVALAALQATDWRGAAVAAISALIAGWKSTEALRARVYSPHTAEDLVTKALKVAVAPQKETKRA